MQAEIVSASSSDDTRKATRSPKRFSISVSVPSVSSTMSCRIPAVMTSSSLVIIESI